MPPNLSFQCTHTRFQFPPQLNGSYYYIFYIWVFIFVMITIIIINAEYRHCNWVILNFTTKQSFVLVWQSLQYGSRGTCSTSFFLIAQSFLCLCVAMRLVSHVHDLHSFFAALQEHYWVYSLCLLFFSSKYCFRSIF